MTPGRRSSAAVAAACLLASAAPVAAVPVANPVATFSGLDKITAQITNFDVYMDETVQFGSLQITPRACYTRPQTEAPQTVSVQNNLPNANAGQQPGAGSQDSRQEETTNYEISKTVRTLIKDQPQIDRIDLAVMVDGTDVAAADGKHSWQPRSATQPSIRSSASWRSAVLVGRNIIPTP